MPYLFDTNIWLELLLEQQQAELVRRLFAVVPAAELAITDFALHSIGLSFQGRWNRPERYKEFLRDMIEETATVILRLSPAQLKEVIDAAETYGLDFDDAYQYMAAQTHGYRLVSFDRDFTRTPEGAEHPDAVIAVKTTEERDAAE